MLLQSLKAIWALYTMPVLYGFTKSHTLFIRQPDRVYIDLVPSFLFNFLLLQFGSYLFQTEVDCVVVANLTDKIRAWDLSKNSLWSRTSLALIQRDLDQALLSFLFHTQILQPYNAFDYFGRYPDLQEGEEENVSFCICFL